ncbi:Lysophospholipase, alpha-beta hydrolase superfamily [Nakamurella panacisegetis]|uniref:Lysophospholipase, alpha-beta hydrolase superfamily n=1 Tax=Nakamurella panacisegetis TaxID=1090615 RepID=A0A1H0LCB5_9ACTN|nr:alpha/beta hydrolase [Nakamurella panacisegetis]SDO65732.1 Lysophospholipase, alpha-beta hydrolase superfamily [Nakamurella panacisegetis]
MSAPVPGWFDEAVRTPRGRGSAAIGGVEVRWQTWGRTGDPTVVLVHGGAANATWWHGVAPGLAQTHRVAAIDLSGHGDSDHVPTGYSFETWAAEVIEVARKESSGGRPWIVGHSMGALVALDVAARYGPELAGVVGVDVPEEVLSPRAIPTAAELPLRPRGQAREEMIARFRTRPSDPATQEFIRRYVAEHSVTECGSGWGWKFDPRVTLHGHFDQELLRKAGCPVSLVMAERGLLSADDVDILRKILESGTGHEVAVSWIADSGHHVMLDQPQRLTEALAARLAAASAHADDDVDSCVL